MSQSYNIQKKIIEKVFQGAYFRSGVTGYCHELVGTDGTQYPPFVSMVKFIFIFKHGVQTLHIIEYCMPINLN